MTFNPVTEFREACDLVEKYLAAHPIMTMDECLAFIEEEMKKRDTKPVSPAPALSQSKAFCPAMEKS